VKVKRLDRVAIMVRDIDKAIGFFSEKLGLNFRELSSIISERDGVRCFTCHDAQLEIVSPILPLRPNAPLPLRQRVELLKEKEMIIIGLMFEVEDPTETARELEQQGIRMQHTYEKSHDYVSVGMDNFDQFVAHDKDTFGVVMGFGKYDLKEDS